MEEGDTILSINRQLVSSPEDVKSMQQTLKPGQAVAVHIVRGRGADGHRVEPERYYLSGRLPEQ
jgi:S1-C subfamily serine protease